MAAPLPNATALGAPPALPGPRPVANFDTSAIGEGLATLGAATEKTAAYILAGRQKQQEADAWSSYLVFKAGEDKAFVDATNSVKPGEVNGWAASYGGSGGDKDTGVPPSGYIGRAKAFLEGLPNRSDIRQSYGDRVFSDFQAVGRAALEFERGEQVKLGNAKTDSMIEQTIMPRARLIAQLPTGDPNKVNQLAELEADGARLIDESPFLAPLEKEKAKIALLAKVHAGFADSLPAEERLDVDPGAPKRPDRVDWSTRLNGLSYLAKVASAHDGALDYAHQQTQAAAQQKAAYQTRFNAALNLAAEGNFKLQDLVQAKETWLTDFDDATKLTTVIKDYAKDEFNLVASAKKIFSPKTGGYQFVTGDKADRDSVNLFVKNGPPQNGNGLLDDPAPPVDDNGKPIVGPRGPDNFTAQDWAMFSALRTGIVADRYVNQISDGIYSPDRKQAEHAFTLMDAYAHADERLVAQFSDADRRRLDLYQMYSPLLAPDDLWTMLDVRDATEQKLQADLRKKGLDEVQKTTLFGGRAITLDDFVRAAWPQPLFTYGPASVPGGKPPDNPTDPSVRNALENDFQNLFALAYGYTHGDDNKAKELAAKWIKHKWGVTEVGSGPPAIMQYPPNFYYDEIDKKWDWIDEQILNRLHQIDPKLSRYEITPAHQAGGEIAAGRLPGYYVLYPDENGIWQPIRMDDGTVAVQHFDHSAAWALHQQRFEADREAARIDSIQAHPIRDALGALPRTLGIPTMDLPKIIGTNKNVRDVGKWLLFGTGEGGDRAAPPTPGQTFHLDLPRGAPPPAAANYNYSQFGAQGGVVRGIVERSIREGKAATPDEVLNDPASRAAIIRQLPQTKGVFDKMGKP